MSNERYVVTVGRQLGSGGREVGERLAQVLGIAYFDRQLLKLASEESGVSSDFFKKADEYKQKFSVRGFFGSRLHPAQPISMGYQNHLDNDSLFSIQSDVIRKLAGERSCLFIGRCADYIMRDNPRCVNLFVMAPHEARLARIKKRHPEYTTHQIERFMQKADRQRAAYYNYYTGKTWGAASSYHLCIDSSLLGVDATVELCRQFIVGRLHL
ncbi:MAG: cytidylate kinase-like family protein [Bacteroidales bacterium]|nr:cytidylate kinase-like family protein [Bacteroidales bacterium]